MLKIAFAQINTTVGDLSGNIKKMRQFAKQAKEEYAADLIVFPELVISGYHPDDLLYRKDFIDDCHQALLDYAASTPDIGSIVGAPYFMNDALWNTAIFIQDGKVNTIYCKQKLPNYGVFDEKRYFSADNKPCVIQLKNTAIGICICEDIWTPEVTAQLKAAKADIILSINASPFEIDKHEKRITILQARTREVSLPILYVNCMGGQDGLIFDGGSMLLDANGKTVIQSVFFEETFDVFSFENKKFSIEQSLLRDTPCSGEIIRRSTWIISPEQGVSLNHEANHEINKIYHALKLGIQDYVKKNGFKKIIVGSSGGIDSAVTLAIATDALGAENVSSVMMPSKYTAQMSLDDAEALAKNLNIHHQTLSITECFNAFLSTLSDSFKNLPADKTEENLQARCRGVLLMALSNKTGALVLTTGNRSEMAVGYATLYGDMAGGFAVLKDVYKTDVYKLAEYINREQEIIPKNIIVRPPSAELREDQKDEDSLPPYPILDKILALYLDEEASIDEMVMKGFDRALVEDIVKLIHLNEYKRQQSPPGIRIHSNAFGRDRRYPITHRFVS